MTVWAYVAGVVGLLFRHYVGWTPRARERKKLKQQIRAAEKEFERAKAIHEDAVCSGAYSDYELVVYELRRDEAADWLGKLRQRLR